MIDDGAGAGVSSSSSEQETLGLEQISEWSRDTMLLLHEERGRRRAGSPRARDDVRESSLGRIPVPPSKKREAQLMRIEATHEASFSTRHLSPERGYSQIARVENP